MVVRTYFSRNNTIVKNQTINTGQNPVTELFYGNPNNNHSRFLFQFDLARLETFRTQGMFPSLNKLKHTLKLTNTGSFDLSQTGKEFNGMDRSSSFDLVLYKLNENWDEGVGYDYYDYYESSIINDSLSISTYPSNWFQSHTNILWSTAGAVTNYTVLATQHFERGNENIEMDITNVVNGMLSGDTNFGFCLAYNQSLEQTIRDNTQYVGFFTRNTQTFYEPYIESIYNDTIIDDRINFYTDKNNRLYLYSNVGGKPTNLDIIPTVNVVDDDGNLILTALAKSASQGVYYIDINIPSNSQNECTMFSDIWTNIEINGIQRPDIEMDFSLKTEGYYDIGSDVGERVDYIFSVLGIKHGETIKRGDIRKVSVKAKIPYTSNQNVAIEDVKYRLYVKEGKSEFTVIDYQPMNMAKNENYFLLDTESLLPNTYYLNIKYSSDYEVKTQSESIKFEIVNQSELRKSQ